VRLSVFLKEKSRFRSGGPRLVNEEEPLEESCNLSRILEDSLHEEMGMLSDCRTVFKPRPESLDYYYGYTVAHL